MLIETIIMWLFLGKNYTWLDEENLIKTEHEFDMKYWCREDHTDIHVCIDDFKRSSLTILGGGRGLRKWVGL